MEMKESFVTVRVAGTVVTSTIAVISTLIVVAVSPVVPPGIGTPLRLMETDVRVPNTLASNITRYAPACVNMVSVLLGNKIPAGELGTFPVSNTNSAPPAMVLSEFVL